MSVALVDVNRRPGRVCSVCAHPHQGEILEQVLNGRPYRVIAREFGGLSADSIRRHVRHQSPEVRELALRGVSGLGIAGRVLEIADSARDLRLDAEERGTESSIRFAAYLELAALRTLSDRLGVEEGGVLAELENATTFVTTIAGMARSDSDLRERVAAALDSEGREDLAALVRPNRTKSEGAS